MLCPGGGGDLVYLIAVKDRTSVTRWPSGVEFQILVWHVADLSPCPFSILAQAKSTPRYCEGGRDPPVSTADTFLSITIRTGSKCLRQSSAGYQMSQLTRG